MFRLFDLEEGFFFNGFSKGCCTKIIFRTCSFLLPPRFEINHAADSVSEAIRKLFVLWDIKRKVFKRILSKPNSHKNTVIILLRVLNLLKYCRVWRADSRYWLVQSQITSNVTPDRPVIRTGITIQKPWNFRLNIAMVAAGAFLWTLASLGLYDRCTDFNFRARLVAFYCRMISYLRLIPESPKATNCDAAEEDFLLLLRTAAYRKLAQKGRHNTAFFTVIPSCTQVNEL